MTDTVNATLSDSSSAAATTTITDAIELVRVDDNGQDEINDNDRIDFVSYDKVLRKFKNKQKFTRTQNRKDENG